MFILMQHLSKINPSKTKGIFHFIVPVILIVLFSGCNRTRIDQPEITTEELSQHIYFLASDSLKGRYPGTPGCRTAARYIRDHFKESGITLLGDQGFEYFKITKDIKDGKHNFLQMGNIPFTKDSDFAPMSFTTNDSLTAGIVFAGYGFDIDEDSLKWHDYKNVDIKGKWALVLRGDPEPDNLRSPFIPYSKDRDKAMTAMDKGAAGILFVSGHEFDARDQLCQLRKNIFPVSIPAIQITRKTANRFLSGTGKTIEGLEQEMIKSRKTESFVLPGKVSGRAEVIKEKVSTANVVAMLKGSDPKLKDQYLVIGAHYDHLGMGGPNTTSRRPDTVAVHYGADDNASGTASVIELAEKFASRKDSIRRSIIFVCFSAEEMGLLGSKHFVNDSLIDLKKVDAMINIDMVGRLKPDNRLEIGGTGTSPLNDSLIKATPGVAQFKLALSPEGYGPSDHASFYGKDIPVFFFSAGAHLDYHTPFDTPDKINYDGLKKVDDYIFTLAYDLVNMDQRLPFQLTGPKEGSGISRRGFKVTLGFMPDYTGDEKRGLRVTMVIPGRPAILGGMKNGDIITAVNGRPVKNIYDYMYRLAKLHVGETIAVEVLRNDQKKVLLIQL